MKRLLVLWLVVASGASVPMSAQVCMSRAPFGVGRTRIGGGVASQARWKAYSAEAAMGSLHGAFGTIGLSHSILDGSDATTTLLSGRIGGQRTVSQDETVQFCPFLGLGYLTASSRFGVGTSGDSNFVNDQKGVQYELGAAIGKRWTASEALDVLPSLAIAILGSRMSSTIEVGGVRTASSITTTGPRELVTASLGFQVQRRLTITPFAAKTINAGGSSSLGVTATISFGPPAQ